MKKKILICIVPAVLLLAVLFVPFKAQSYDDGGTKEYTALTYKIVKWNKITNSDVYHKIRIYSIPKNFKSIDELWQIEEEQAEHKLIAEVIELNGNTAVVKPIETEYENSIISSRITFDTGGLPDISICTGDYIEITYKGSMRETYPAQINATDWTVCNTLRTVAYSGDWLDQSSAAQADNNTFNDIIITKIFSDCFFAQTVIPHPYEIKLNGKLPDKWCVGDQIICTYENTFMDGENHIEADFLTVQESSFKPDPNVCYKPVLYLYPIKETKVSVSLELNGRLTCTYPHYENGWKVTAQPDGTLADIHGKTYNYLYWEGETFAQYDFSEGFCIKGENTAEFLEAALAQLGLNRREANEFIVYWLPQMQNNPYNIIAFQTDAYTEAAKLHISPQPDTLIRVFMAYKPSDHDVAINEQSLSAPLRTGFTAVEWGGTEIN